MLTKDELPECPWATTIWLIGGKWKLMILRNLVLFESCRFEELYKSLNGISRRVLANDLRKMEEDGIIVRKVYDEKPVRVEYSLSELGETLKPIFHLIGEWGTNYQNLVRNGAQDSGSIAPGETGD